MTSVSSCRPLELRHLGQRHYEPVWQDMRAFTDSRTESTVDQLWLVEHHPVYTLGQAGRMEHVLDAGDIPVVRSDRGGQVTYHGPGQVVAYLLADVRRLGIGVRTLVGNLENAVVALLSELGLDANADDQARGVYIAGRKIAAVGLRVRRGCSYHGISLNVAMDLTPFQRINPCGYEGLVVTDLASEEVDLTMDEAEKLLIKKLATEFGYVPGKELL